MKNVFAKLSLLALFFCFYVPAHAQARTTPDCLNEQLTQNALTAALLDPALAAGAAQPPGTLIMTGPFGDPLYQAPGWEKRQWTMYFNDTKVLSPGKLSRTQYTVAMHYMWNVITRQFAQVKFHTTTNQGCVGSTTVSQPAGGTDQPLVGFREGYAADNWSATSYERVPGGVVRIGPVTPVGSGQSLVWDGSGGAFGDGSYGGYSGGSGHCRTGCQAPTYPERVSPGIQSSARSSSAQTKPKTSK